MRGSSNTNSCAAEECLWGRVDRGCVRGRAGLPVDAMSAFMSAQGSVMDSEATTHQAFWLYMFYSVGHPCVLLSTALYLRCLHAL